LHAVEEKIGHGFVWASKDKAQASLRTPKKILGVRVACHRFVSKAQDKAQASLRTPKKILGVRVACHRFVSKAQDKAQASLRTPKCEARMPFMQSMDTP